MRTLMACSIFCDVEVGCIMEGPKDLRSTQLFACLPYAC